MSHFVGVAALTLALSGCVAQEKYNALKLDRDGLAEQLGKAQTEASSARAEAESYKNQLASLMANGGNLQGLVSNLQQQNANLQAQLDDINRRYAEALNKVGTGGPALPPALTNELQQFANQNPDLVDFDSARGIVKFKSDVTFAPGSAEVTAKAKDVLQRFSQILNSDAASRYDLMVAGHTDNTRVVNPATINAGHKDNWYLSAHRAIAVNSVLLGHSVNSQRLAVVGYADQRPIASNSSESGKSQNRRVEVLILPSQMRSSAPAVASTPKSSSKKDRSADVDRNPALNK
jgi:chemotaxis protein MotB